MREPALEGESSGRKRTSRPRGPTGRFPLTQGDLFFYLSYPGQSQDGSAANGPDLWIAHLYEALCGHVRASVDLSSSQKSGFMNRELRDRHERPSWLSSTLRTRRVFGSLYSRRYFKNQHCGKKWLAFQRCVISQPAATGGRTRQGDQSPALVPPQRDWLGESVDAAVAEENLMLAFDKFTTHSGVVRSSRRCGPPVGAVRSVHARCSLAAIGPDATTETSSRRHRFRGKSANPWRRR
jgi:hypothetical protein